MRLGIVKASFASALDFHYFCDMQTDSIKRTDYESNYLIRGNIESH